MDILKLVGKEFENCMIEKQVFEMPFIQKVITSKVCFIMYYMYTMFEKNIIFNNKYPVLSNVIKINNNINLKLIILVYSNYLSRKVIFIINHTIKKKKTIIYIYYNY